LESENGPAKGKIRPRNEDNTCSENITSHFKVTRNEMLSRVGSDDFSAFRTV